MARRLLRRVRVRPRHRIHRFHPGYFLTVSRYKTCDIEQSECSIRLCCNSATTMDMTKIRKCF